MILIRLTLTALLVILAVAGVTFVWTTYFENPWTRDGRVRASIVEIASNVAGDVVEIHAANNEAVAQGDVIVEIDARSYEAAVAQATSSVAVAAAAFENARQKSDRQVALRETDPSAVASVTVIDAQLQTASAKADLEMAQAELQSAALDLSRTKIVAPVDGYVTNLTAEVGDFASPGAPLIALIDANSYRVDAFFMETKLPEIALGEIARVRLMSGGPVLTGTVTGIARAIDNSQNISQSLLQAPEASFEWIRLAQRVPVEITLDDVPAEFPLVSGATASVILGARRPGWRGWFGRD